MSDTTAKLHLFKSSLPSCRFIFSNGKVANFVRGQYTTTLENEIKELEAEVAEGNPHIYIDNSQKTISVEELDPLYAIKKKAIEEYLAQQQKAVNPNNDMGNTVQAAAARPEILTSRGVPNAASTIQVGSKAAK